MNLIKKMLTNPLFFLSQEKNISSRRKLYNSLWAIFFGLTISGIIILILGANPFDVFSKFFAGAFNDLEIKNFWINFAIFAICGISVGVGFKVGLFNIGAAGQMMFGGMLAIYFILSNGIISPAWVYIVSILIAIVAAMFLALIAAILKAFLNVHEVVTTILLNWIAVYIGSYLFNNSSPFKHRAQNGSLQIENTQGFFSTSTFWIIGIIIVLILSISIWFVLQKTTLGYKIKMTGLNKDASKYAGVNEKTTILSTLAFSGALAGLAGWIFYVVVIRSYEAKTTPISYGFDGIAISLLAYNNPIGILFSSLLYSVFETGSTNVALNTPLSKEAVSIIPSIILYLAALSTLFMNFKVMSWLRKNLFLITQKTYWHTFKGYYDSKLIIIKQYHLKKKLHNIELKKNKVKIQEIKKTLKTQLDFKTLEKMTNDQKLDYYDKIQKAKNQHLMELKELGYFKIKELKTNVKTMKLNSKKAFIKFKNELFDKNKNTSKEWIYVPVLKAKAFKTKKGGDK